jgi:hypothetical protein
MTERRIGRILSLGFPLPGPQVDNYNFLTAPAFFDYDALVVDPQSLSALIEATKAGATEQTFGGATVRNTPQMPSEVALGELLMRRRDETWALLDRGGCVVSFAAPPVAHGGIEGIAVLAGDWWLPYGVRSAIAAAIVPADGTRAIVVDVRHPLAAFVERESANIAYRAIFEPERIDDAGSMTVFARSAGGKAVGVELRTGKGRVILLPALRQPPAGDQRYAMSDALQAGIRRALGVAAEGRPPAWAEDREIPGLAERATALEAARERETAAAGEREQAEARFDELARFRRLLWQEGALGIEDVVAEALRVIGFEARMRGDGAIEVPIDGGALLVEVDAGEHAIGMAAHRRLRARIEAAIASRGVAPRGLLLVNGYRLQPPDRRPQQVDDALRTAAETMRYAIATTASLFDAVVASLGGAHDVAEDYRRRIATTDGIVA